MSTNKMLIDASHSEETRVVVIRDNEIEEFDFESAARKLLKGSIFLAKVTRVEPSLQAAFVDYGGNRHGFLAFTEIHPDYYQIPYADRLALLQEEQAAQEAGARAEEEEFNGEASRRVRRRGHRRGSRPGYGERAGARDVDADHSPGARSDFEGDDEGEGSGAEGSLTGGAGEQPHIDTYAFEQWAVDVSHLLPAEIDEAQHSRVSPSEADHSSNVEAERSETIGGAAGNADESAASDQSGTSGTEQSASDDQASATADPAESAAQKGEKAGRRGRGRSQAIELPRDESISAEVGSGETLRPPQDTQVAVEETRSETAEAAHEDADATRAAAEVTRSRGDTSAVEQDSELNALAEDVRSDGDEIPFPEEIQTDAADDDPLEEARPRRRKARSYKIQEVIKRRQVVLVQVVKEARGTKGAALTTYLSLAGRYTVLMPNTARGGGISRKITNAQDRKSLKAIAQELDVPEGMGLIIRTAGASRTKQEIKRDFEYLLRLWESVRDLTLRSMAPSLVYEEGDLIKRSIRDLYTKDIEEICVAGEAAYRDAKDFMRMLMPSHAKNVVKYEGAGSLFADHGVEQKLADMFSPVVRLRSGGYLVINQTEALVAIDINSGKATREFSIEETAFKTNLEAAEEIARQLKLRDLAGLIVIDFIDMDEKRNNRAVERRLKECLKRDRARIQVGRISHFGLLEMSRQRMRTGVLEGSTTQCPHCQGAGTIRSVQSVALAVLRGIEDALMRDPSPVTVRAPMEVAFYILNQKRTFLAGLEARYECTIRIIGVADIQGSNFEIECGSQVRHQARRPERVERAERAERRAVRIDAGFEEPSDEEDEVEEIVAQDEEPADDQGAVGGRRRRRRGRRGDGDYNRRERAAAADSSFEADGEEDDQAETYAPNGRDGDGDDREQRGRRSRRRGRRGGRRGRDRAEGGFDYVSRTTPDVEIFGVGMQGYRGQAAAVATAALRISGADVMIHGEVAAELGITPMAGNDRPAAKAREVVTEALAEATADETGTVRSESAGPGSAGRESGGLGSVANGAGHEAPKDLTEAAARAPEKPPEAEQAQPDKPEEAQLPKWRARSLESGPPVIQRVVVRTDGQTANAEPAANDEESSQPRRKGWWQRTFGD